MKYSMIVLVSLLTLVGCGGGESSSSTSTPATDTNTPNVEITPVVTAPAYDLVINNGRGTSNNQETENPN